MKKIVSLVIINTLLACGSSNESNNKNPYDPAPKKQQSTLGWSLNQKNEAVKRYSDSLDAEIFILTDSNRLAFGECGYKVMSDSMTYQKWVQEARPDLNTEDVEKCLVQAQIKEKIAEEVVTTPDSGEQPDTPLVEPVIFNFDNYVQYLKEDISNEIYLKDVDQDRFNDLVQQLQTDTEKYMAAYKILDDGLLDSIYQRRTLIVALSKIPKIESSDTFTNFIDSSLENKFFIRELLYSISANEIKDWSTYSVILHVFTDYREDIVLLDMAYKSLKQFGYFENMLAFFPAYDLKIFIGARADSSDVDVIKLTVARLMLGVEHLTTLAEIFKTCADKQGNLESSDLKKAADFFPSYFLKYEAMKKVKESGDLSNLDPGVRAFVEHPNFDKLMEVVEQAWLNYKIFAEYAGI